MIENESLGIFTILKVVVGPLVLALALAYGIYRSRLGRVGTTRENTPKVFVAMAVASLIAFCIVIVIGSVVITRSINQTAETTGSSTRPAEPGSGMDKVNREQSREMQEPNGSNVPPSAR
jgi:predicted PurR-regulated permease PerM